jgi:hypothetical protein
MNVSFTDMETHLLVECSGQWEHSAVSDLAARINKSASELSLRLILVDWLKVTSPVTELHRFLAGETVAKVLCGFKIAVLYPEDLINKFAENTAVNRGGIFLVTHNEEMALQWLLEDMPNN